ncbi:replication restart helicase PriA [Zavarzinella formosa]|uniref:replication restart helicase PriA n=1 Tax=Zavarzinella formosa TaxID=360055 RepID=UPI0003092E38|nr:primosomal protein N' [Zavarzinella formosa]
MLLPDTMNDESAATETPIPAGVYADIVFDRPLDHPYSYSVPEELQSEIAVGKRVEVPFGRGDTGTTGYCVRVHEIPPLRAVKAIRKILDEQSLLTDSLLRLTRWMADYYLCGWGQVLQAVLPAGVRDQSGTREAAFIQAVPEADLPAPLQVLTPKQSQTLEHLRNADGPMEQRHLARLAKVGAGVVKSLVEKGYARKFTERVEKTTLEADLETVDHRALTLNAEQQAVWETIEAAVNTGGYHSFLLHGVTGSGKTEVYLRAIEQVVAQGKEALVLVPEISLTPQTISRFRGRCGNVAVMHSHLTDSERGAYWRGIASGHVQVVVGARSAVFAPTRKLGIIIIDEEHENSFKQESTPRYHARDVAVMRAKLENIPIVLGSATPSLESWANAERGQYSRLDLPNRVEARPMPPVKLIDMRHEPRSSGTFSAISPTLERAMRDALGKGGQVILLLNRRGFSTHVHCPTCGFVANCQNCDLALTFHRQRSSLVCHYCGHEQTPFRKCPTCQTPSILYQGMGTEKLQAEIEQKFPDRVTQRMDSDTMSRPGSHQRVLDAFRGGLVHILMGTQMIAKGLDFPNVTLVGVINADAGLHMPDFRAGERTFQLLAQVSGRAGRGDLEGQVMIQTYTPDHPSITLAAKHDYLKFAELELAQRKEHQYPPYQRLVRLIVRSENEEAARNFADLLAGAFREALHRADRQPPQSPGVRLLGPAEAPVYRLNGYFRHHFQLQSSSPGLLHQVLREVLAVARQPSNVEYQVDVDPFNMM